MPKIVDKFPDELDVHYETIRRLLLEKINAWIEKLSEEDRNTPHKSVGGKVFTPLLVQQAVEESTQYGRLFVNQYSAHLIETAKWREEKKNARFSL